MDCNVGAVDRRLELHQTSRADLELVLPTVQRHRPDNRRQIALVAVPEPNVVDDQDRHPSPLPARLRIPLEDLLLLPAQLRAPLVLVDRGPRGDAYPVAKPVETTLDNLTVFD
jgi:hypothetical protein